MSMRRNLISHPLYKLPSLGYRCYIRLCWKLASPEANPRIIRYDIRLYPSSFRCISPDSRSACENQGILKVNRVSHVSHCQSLSAIIQNGNQRKHRQLKKNSISKFRYGSPWKKLCQLNRSVLAIFSAGINCFILGTMMCFLESLTPVDSCQ